MEFDEADAFNQAIRLLSLRHRARVTALLAPMGLFPGQEALLLELARTGPMIQAQLSDAIGCEPPSVTLMARKLEASGYLQRSPSPTDRRASIVQLTVAGRALVAHIRQAWCLLAEETVVDLPHRDVQQLTDLLTALAQNVDSRQRRTESGQ